MEAVIFCGIQAAGKTTFYVDHFLSTHVRISMDMLRTRRRERLLLEACLRGGQAFVVDNTNVTVEQRAMYVGLALEAKFRIACFYFVADPRQAFARNRRRPGRANVPPAGVFGTQKRLQPPTVAEGYHELVRVELVEGAGFTVERIHPSG